MKKRKSSDKRNPLISTVLGVCAALAVLLITAGAVSLIAISTRDPARALPALALAALVVASAITSVILTAKGGTALSLPSAVGAAVVMLVCGIISEGRVTPESLINGGCYLAVSLLFALLAKRRSETHRRRRHRA